MNQIKRREKSKDKGILLKKQRESIHKQLATQRGTAGKALQNGDDFSRNFPKVGKKLDNSAKQTSTDNVGYRTDSAGCKKDSVSCTTDSACSSFLLSAAQFKVV
ncbi:MAG: hypothetical protein IJT97_04535 [Bacteroidaceae bacterium]|nr:hypothetical protein [Bacteroidaceae bacterium]